MDLLILRGQVLGRITDYERADRLSQALVYDAPRDGTARLARARARATFHRFAEALADLDTAQRHGTDKSTLDIERAAILQALGCNADALVLCRDAARHRPGFAAFGALAVLHAERGDVMQAERLFGEARRTYRATSPFPLASLDFRRGLMWRREHDLTSARSWFDTAVHRVPAYAPALGQLAELDATLGARQAAIDRLCPLAASGDDPGYAAALAGVLRDAGHHQQAARWRATAAARYEELAQRHPGAFAHHADRPAR